MRGGCEIEYKDLFFIWTKSRLNAGSRDDLRILLRNNNNNGHVLPNRGRFLSDVDYIGDPVRTFPKYHCRAISNAANSIFHVLKITIGSLSCIAGQKKWKQVFGAVRLIQLL